MAEESRPNNPLQYASPGTAPEHRWVRWLARLPLWFIGLSLFLPIWTLGEFGKLRWQLEEVLPALLFLALFIPGALRRLRWRDCLVMAVLASIAFVLTFGPVGKQVVLSFPHGWVYWVAIPILLVGLGETLLTRRLSMPVLLRVLMLSLALAHLLVLILEPLGYVVHYLQLPRLGGGYRAQSLSSWLYWPAVLVVTWVALPRTLRRDPRPARPWRLAVATGAPVLAFAVFFYWLVYPIAQHSLLRGWAFNRDIAAQILELRPQQHHHETLWAALETADWSEPEQYAIGDYRRSCIRILQEQDPDAAWRLAALLRGHPTTTLTDLAAPILAKEKRFEAVPELMRAALLGSYPATEALEAMNVPHVALAIIWSAALWDRPAPLTPDFAIIGRDRSRLTHLLGEDAGPNLSDWSAHYDQVIDQLPSPLPDHIQSETNRVIRASISYYQALSRWQLARDGLAVRRMEQDGLGEYVKAAQQTKPMLMGERKLTPAEERALAPSLTVIERYVAEATRDLEVALPDWTVAGTDRLEQEVRDYRERVEAIIARHAAPGSAVERNTK